MGTEMQRQLSQTVFQVEPLKNIVGVGDTAAFQIVVRSGPTLGTLGIVNVPAYADICNDPDFDTNFTRVSARGRIGPLIRRALATLKY
jgi:hypothetical protein